MTGGHLVSLVTLMFEQQWILWHRSKMLNQYFPLSYFAYHANYFLPQGAINLLMHIYRREFSTMGGYLTDAGEVNFFSSVPCYCCPWNYFFEFSF